MQSKMMLLKRLYCSLIWKVNAIQSIGTSDLIEKADYIIKIEEPEKKIPDHDRYMTNDY